MGPRCCRAARAQVERCWGRCQELGPALDAAIERGDVDDVMQVKLMTPCGWRQHRGPGGRQSAGGGRHTHCCVRPLAGAHAPPPGGGLGVQGPPPRGEGLEFRARLLGGRAWGSGPASWGGGLGAHGPPPRGEGLGFRAFLGSGPGLSLLAPPLARTWPRRRGAPAAAPPRPATAQRLLAPPLLPAGFGSRVKGFCRMFSPSGTPA
jgi:hypothetical protein